jgi:nitrite reductase (NADH) large subunit
MSKRIVVVGHGMVGQRFLETLTDGSSDFAITMLAEEPRLAYDRVNLSKYFSGSSVEDLTLTTREFFDKNGIELYSGDPVAAIDRVNKRVTTKSGAEYEYDILILATGSSPFVPPIPGRDRPGVFVYRTIEDLEAITEAGKNSTRGVVIGGGLLGLEAAKALKDLGLATNVVEFAPRLMAVQVDEGGGGLLRSRIEALGVAVHTGKNTTRIDDGETARHRMHFADGG